MLFPHAEGPCGSELAAARSKALAAASAFHTRTAALVAGRSDPLTVEQFVELYVEVWKLEMWCLYLQVELNQLVRLRSGCVLSELYDAAVHKLLGELGLSLLEASNKSEWHNITRREALAARAASKLPAGLGVAAQRPSAVTNGAASTSRATAIGASASSAKCKPESRNKPTKPAISNLGCGP